MSTGHARSSEAIRRQYERLRWKAKMSNALRLFTILFILGVLQPAVLLLAAAARENALVSSLE